MRRRINEADIIALALFLRKEYCGTDMLSLNKAVEFNKTININLKKANSSTDIGFWYGEYIDFYSFKIDENYNCYAIINEDADIKKARDYHIGCLPNDVILAAYDEKALQTIGLMVVDNKIVNIPCQVDIIHNYEKVK